MSTPSKYICIFIWMLGMYIAGRLKWRSRWSILFTHIIVRIASQICGIGFSILGFGNVSMFLAFLILGAEGYFTLVLCTFRFVISWHQHNFPNGISWLEPRRDIPSGLTREQKLKRTLTFLFLGPFALFIYRDNVMAAFHLVLIVANAIIISGGSFLANADLSDFGDPETVRKLRISKIMRTSGQAIFLACNTLLLLIILVTIRQSRKMRKAAGESGVHPTLWVLLITWVPLIIRGVFGVLQSADFELSYYNPENYGPHGFSDHFTLVEYLMGVTTEWLACVLLCVTYFTSKNDPPKPKPEGSGESKSEA
ncbi:hypothetical protein MKEN_00031200 [Mycena kentingensis (nom. inval.)]|nr:hypothetical protein MKEN_00031200 [Mycena kentingensis (nom. inval.)]